MRGILIVFFCFSTTWLQGQFAFKQINEVPVTSGGQLLPKAWTGGLNSTQFLKMDLDGDQVEDLVVFHRISQELQTYLARDEQYVFAPDYISSFPSDIANWLVLADYNCDGKKDIFTSTPLGVKVYLNTTTGAFPTFQEAQEFLTFDSGLNLQINASDIPGIADIDGDGDLDLLAYRFSTASTIDFYKNTSVEDTGNCGQLTFTRETRRWGNFEECDCNSMVFGGAVCPAGATVNPALDEVPFSANAEEHAGGKTILLIDIDNDGDYDLITSDEFCETLYFLENEGDAQNANMTAFSSFPETDPAAFFIFPSAFYEDIDFDGNNDLIISSNADQNVLNQADFSQNTSVYINQNTSAQPQFSSNAIPFFQNEMIDLGETAYPTLADVDADGDLDLVVGNRGKVVSGQFRATLMLIENTGTRLNPSFEIVDEDYLGISAQNLRNLKPQLVDINLDGAIDIVYQGTDTNNQTRIYYRLNTSGSGNALNFGEEQSLNILPSENDHFYLVDVTGDGPLDLLLGRRLGSLQLFRNTGDLTFAESNDSFADLSSDFNRRNLVPAVADINGDGRTELITTDNSGALRVHRGSMNVNFRPDSVFTRVLFNESQDVLEVSGFGEQSPFAIADIYGNGLPALIMGTNRGGLYLLENLSDRNIGTTNRRITIEVFPNPSNTVFRVQVDVNAQLELYTIIGQKVNDGITINRNETIEIDGSALKPGIYLLRAVNGIDQPAVKRIIIEH